MNKVIGIMLMLVMVNCAPTIKNSPTISCKKAKLVLERGANTTTRTYVKLKKISPGYLTAWLYENDPHIMYKESARCILCNHIIAKLNQFEFGRVKASLKFRDIRDRLARTQYPLMDSFRHFVEVSFTADNRLELDSSTSFEPNKHYFSMAFFMAFTRTNNFTDSAEFTFHKATYRGNSVIIIEVFDGSFRNFYDFAQYPPLR